MIIHVKQIVKQYSNKYKTYNEIKKKITKSFYCVILILSQLCLLKWMIIKNLKYAKISIMFLKDYLKLKNMF